MGRLREEGSWRRSAGRWVAEWGVGSGEWGVADSSEEAVVGVGDAGVTSELGDVRESGHGRNPVQGEKNEVERRL
jgi:hypothetical protein